MYVRIFLFLPGIYYQWQPFCGNLSEIPLFFLSFLILAGLQPEKSVLNVVWYYAEKTLENKQLDWFID